MQLALILALIAVPARVAADSKYDVDVEIAYGLNHDPKLKAKVERNTAALLTALNMASALHQGLNYKDIGISQEAKANLNNLWKGKKIVYASFDDDFNTPLSEKVTINKFGDYELRNIPVIFMDENNPEDSHYEEIGITFDRNGIIQNVYVTIQREQFSKMLKGMSVVKDENDRLEVLNLMESLATAYHQKDIAWFQKFLSDDVLVVTGSKKYTPKGETFVYTEHGKQDYIKKLKRCFDVNPRIDVKFSDLTIMGHALDQKGRYYAVECVQSWDATHYSDVGRLFIVWDFGHPSGPQILFRGWTEIDDPKKFNIYEMPLMIE